MAEDNSSGGQGFASMSEDELKQVASQGGKSQGKHNNPANFANDKAKARRAGKRGGSNTNST